ncbi:Abi-like protein [Kribbella steppae]|uniref:Abi-like protein n=1 Tax=Kribbella steppae TaxID=2512223 RepID=A0A4R2HCK3_9ACTN|nr:Abi-like protein [Kribbella steppae]
MEPVAPLPPPAGPWVQRWLSPARLAKYRTATDCDLQRALQLYEWNAKISAALMRDLGHVEIGLRNAYAEVIEHYWSGTPDHWTRSAATLFRPVYRMRDGEPVDINRQQRAQLEEACARVGPDGPPGKVIAELTFGFWRFLSSSAHEKTVWVPFLHRAYPPGTNRKRDVDSRVATLNRLRNRVAHHEPLIGENLPREAAKVSALAGLLDPELGAYVAATSDVPGLLLARP